MSSPAAPEPDSRPALRASLAARLLRWAPNGALFEPAALPGLLMVRNDGVSGPVCGMYQPSVAVMVQGRKRVDLGSDTFVYGEGDCLITSLDLPTVTQILEATPDRPYLAVAMALDLRALAGLLLDPDLPHAAAAGTGRAMAVGHAGAPLLLAFDRLLALLDEPQSIPILAPLLQREILFRVLISDQGARLRQVAAIGSQGQQVAHAIHWLREHYMQPLRIDDLAAQVRMSTSSLHHHFKALTAMSPLQFQKSLRLSEARRLMLSEHLDAATAAYRVGYESASQFSREYSRQYGAPPMRDITQLRAQPSGMMSPA